MAPSGRGKLTEEGLVDRGLHDHVERHDRLPPVVGHERPLAELPEALPGGVLLPDAALVLPESEAGVVIGELGRPIRDARHPPQCVAHLISGAARDGARGCGDDDVRGSHLHGVEHEPGRGVEPRERRRPIVRETPIMAELVVLVEQPVDVRLLSVLHHRVRAVRHLVGVAERVPVVVLERALADVLPVPSVHRDARAQLRVLLEHGAEVQVGGDDLILARSSATGGQMRPGP